MSSRLLEVRRAYSLPSSESRHYIFITDYYRQQATELSNFFSINMISLNKYVSMIL